MKLFSKDKESAPAPRRKRRKFRRWTTRQKLRAAARVGDAAVSTVEDLALLILKIAVSALLVLITAGLLFAIIFAYYVKNNLSTELNISLSDYTVSLSSTIWAYDRNGQKVELAALQTDENRIWLDYEDIPPYFEKAAVAIEDKRFYEHKGVDWYRTAGAFVNMFLGMKNDFGGSTITQQLIKNTTGKDEVTVQRKLVEIFQALDLEKTYTKEEIIEWYLNIVYFGEGAYGVAQAADTYFGKDVQDLTLAQCASIIGITNNPSKYSPFASTANNKKRTKTILYEMYDKGHITREEYEEAVAEVDNDELHFIRGENEIYQQEIYSYYVEMVIRDVIADLQSQLGLSEEAARRLLYHGGYQVYACVDPDVQAVVDGIYRDTANLPKPYYKSDQFLQSACMVVDPYTGEIKAIGGGVGEKNRNFGFNYALDARRPAGSSIKPLASYGPAMDLRLITEATRVNDDKDIVLRGTKWYPHNADWRYSGIISIWDALIASKNTVAAQIIDKLTPSVSFEYLTERMGFQLVEADRDYAPLALGQFTYGVTVREMAQAYTLFPNDGWMNFARSYSLVTDSNGATVLENSQRSNYVFNTDTARCLTEMMEAAAWYGTGYEAYLGYGKMPVAGKTATSSDEFDRWFCGFSPYYVCAVWTGYEIPERMYFNGNPAAQIWKRIMESINANLPIVQFNDPSYRGGDTGIFGNLEVKPEYTPSPTASPTPDLAETPAPEDSAPSEPSQEIPIFPDTGEEAQLG